MQTNKVGSTLLTEPHCSLYLLGHDAPILMHEITGQEFADYAAIRLEHSRLFVINTSMAAIIV